MTNRGTDGRNFRLVDAWVLDVMSPKDTNKLLECAVIF